jgi:iron complex transport system substrate-binding protein
MDSTPRRIVSLLPGATEMVAALGAADRLVGISHECDFPATVTHLPRVTTTPIDRAADSGAIDAAVRGAIAIGRPVIGVEAATIRRLRPDLLITQTLCEVCAVADGAVQQLATVLDPPPSVLALEGRTLEGVLTDVLHVATALGLREAGADLVASRQARLHELRARYRRAEPIPTVVIEWLDPCFLAGHWTPEIVAAAGGRDIAMRPGEHSVARDWREVITLDPEVVVIALCGFDATRADAELRRMDRPEVQSWLAARRVLVIDGNAYTSRAGPRLIEAVEVLGAMMDGRR